MWYTPYMSNSSNDALFERAAAMIDYFEGKQPAETIEADLERGDLEALDYHVRLAERFMDEADHD